jgi:cyclase
MRHCLNLIVLVCVVVFPAAAQDLFDIQPVADGVYAAIAKPAYKLNCNAAIVLMGDGVLVVDTHSKPSAARALIQQIQKITNQPVRYVVNTHFHWDHYQGNEAYPSVWPSDIEIISSEATRSNIERYGIPRINHELLDLPSEIAHLEAQLSSSSDTVQRAAIQHSLIEAQNYLAELKTIQVSLPTITFERSLILHHATRTVEILWLGNAHTNGDVWVYLPKEKILISGDALHGETPYLADSYPYDWIQTLDVAEKLDFEQVIGGHGNVIHGKAVFELWKQYLRDLMKQTADAYEQGASLEEAKHRVAKGLLAKYGKNFDSDFPQDVLGNITKAYRVIASGE